MKPNAPLKGFDLNPEDYSPERYELLDEICEIFRDTFPSSKRDN